jgi:biotin-dependent carboxylase-like uncharacterized protein
LKLLINKVIKEPTKSNPMIEILQHGIYTSIQDMGRFNHQCIGVPLSGALDQQAFRIGNQLLNNPDKAAALECTVKGPKIRFHQNTYIALTGADMRAQLNGRRVSSYTPIEVHENDELELGKAQNGCRTYLTIAGGIKTEKILGSRSQFKGLTREERISKKILLPIGHSDFKPVKGVHLRIPKTAFHKKTIEVYPGPEYPLLDKIQQKALAKNKFSISKLNNRMAYQLNQKLQHQLPQIWTAPVLPGTVQCTPDGSLIILMQDAQVTGGYPRLFQLTDEALHLLAQKQTDDEVQFSILPSVE